MDKKWLDYFKIKLKEEKQRLEKELSDLATKNPKNPEDWVPEYPNYNPQFADASERADIFEEVEAKYSIETVLEERLNEVKKALERIANKTYGICEKDKKPIAVERLKANPAARFCKVHSHLE